jgi:hypothetical protein
MRDGHLGENSKRWPIHASLGAVRLFARQSNEIVRDAAACRRTSLARSP